MSKFAFVDRLTSNIIGVLAFVGAAFLVVPAIVVAIASFARDPGSRFPPQSWGTGNYSSIFENAVWLDAVAVSMYVAILAAASAILIGVPAVFALSRFEFRGREVIRLLGMSSLVIPGTAYAVALYGLFLQFGMIGTKSGLILVHAVLGIPFVLIVCGTAILRIPKDLELVAMTLGASRMRAWLGITLRLLLPSVAAAFIFAFITSFDEGVFVVFLQGPGLDTLPKVIFDTLRYGLDATPTAISTLLMVCSGVLSVLAFRLSRK